ncbi:MAG: metal-dependent hydrolase [Acidimicrobiia bacterium]
MLFWHVGGAIFLFRWIFRDPKVDIRLLALGAVLPDVSDALLGLLIGGPTTQRIGHSLVVPSLAAVVVLLTTRRGRRRRGLMTVVVAWLFHLVLDGVWFREEVFLWPFFGWDLPAPPAGTIGERAAEPWRWLKEAIGLVYLWRLLRTQGS